jgi:DNA-binding transcriptional MerR regulator
MATRTPRVGQLTLDVEGLGGDEDGYRGPAVCSIVGISYRQLDYWARTGLVEPSLRRAEGSGTQRLYAFDDLVRLRVVKRLLDAGVSLQKVRMAIDELSANGRSLADVTIVSDGRRVLAVDDDARLLDLLRGGQGVFAISLEPLVAELKGEVSALPMDRTAVTEVAAARPDDGDAVVVALR